MTKQEFLSASLPYRLRSKSKASNNLYEVIGMTCYNLNLVRIKPLTPEGRDFPMTLEDIIPIVRPFDSLTKECIQADYNDGKPFVPIVELEKLFPNFNLNLLDDNGKDVIGFDNLDMDNDMTICDIIPIIQMLLKWHFWPDMPEPEGEGVLYVTDKFNPYK